MVVIGDRRCFESYGGRGAEIDVSHGIVARRSSIRRGSSRAVGPDWAGHTCGGGLL